MVNEKRRSIKDILGELEIVEKTHSKKSALEPIEKPKRSSNPPIFSATEKDDITDLEHQLPIINTDNEDITPMEDTPPPIPKAAFDDDLDNRLQPEMTHEQHNAYAESWSSSKQINQVEELQQHIMKIEEENRRQKSLLDSQKSELNEYRGRIEEAESENKKLRSELSNAESNVRINFEAQLNKTSIIEEKYHTLAKLHEEMKAKVRRDIRKIRTREKELANKLELMKHDSETLLSAKDHKILQLKQHIDNLDFEIENLKDKIVTLQEEAKETEETAERVVKALRLSTSLLEAANKDK